MTVEIRSANEIRKLCPKTPHEHVADTMEAIEVAARKGEKSIILRSPSIWSDEAYQDSHNWRQACTIFREFGFNVKMHYVESQFVDIGTLVSWEETKSN